MHAHGGADQATLQHPVRRQGMGSMADDDRMLKEMKVRIPEAQHIKLHGLRLVRDQGISESVRAALRTYFGDEERMEPD